jgi:hypothetical protein
MSPVVCHGKRDGRASSLFRVNGNLGESRSFRVSLTIAALHDATILTQVRGMVLNTATEGARIGKEADISEEPS